MVVVDTHTKASLYGRLGVHNSSHTLKYHWHKALDCSMVYALRCPPEDFIYIVNPSKHFFGAAGGPIKM